MSDKRKRYSCKCLKCGKEFWACKSLFQELFNELDKGYGRCPGCNEAYNLAVDEDNDAMILTPYGEYLMKLNDGDVKIMPGDLILWGKRKKLAKVVMTDGQVVKQMEMPPDSGMIYAPLIQDGKNVEDFEKQEQMMFGEEDTE